MTFTSTTPLILAGLLAVTPVEMAATADEVQAPRGQEIQAPRTDDEVQAPRGQEIQAPREEEIQAPRGDGYGPDVPTLRR